MKKRKYLIIKVGEINMFILEGREARAEIRDQVEIDLILNHLESQGYKTLLRSMVRAGCEAVELPSSKIDITSIGTDRLRYREIGERISPIGDILHHENNLFFLFPQKTRLLAWEVRHHSKISRLEDFLSHVEHSIKLNLDGRRVRGMSFEWREAKLDRGRYQRTRHFTSEKLDMKAPDYTEHQLNQAKLMVPEENRNIIVKLAKVGKARFKDVASISDESVTNALLNNGLIKKEYLITCRQDSRTLASVADKTQLESTACSELTCPTCGRSFKTELIQEIFALTEEARFLLNGSKWMTIWVTDLLCLSGLDKGTIKWNATLGDDEIDIVINIIGMQVFFELKDREFGLGDAYPFGFRLERYGGDVGGVITMEKVAPEAEKFLREQSERRIGKIVTIEGWEKIQTDIPGLIDEISRIAIHRFVLQISGDTGLNFRPFIQNWLEKAQ